MRWDRVFDKIFNNLKNTRCVVDVLHAKTNEIV